MASIIRGSDSFNSDHPPGLLNIVSTHLTTVQSQSVAANVQYPITGIEATITPNSNNSKILIFAQWCGECSAGGQENMIFGLSRNGVAIGQPEGSSIGSRNRGILPVAISYAADNNSTLESCQLHYIDSPETKEELTYKMLIMYATAATIKTNQTIGTADLHNYERGTSGITLIELIV